MSHNDYLRLKNELEDFAKDELEESKFQEESVQEEVFSSMNQAIDFFVAQGNLTEGEGDFLRQLNEQKHRKLASIWKVYVAIKAQEDMFNSIRVLLDIEMKNQQQKEVSPPNQLSIKISPNNSSGMQHSGLIKLNMMQGNEESGHDSPIDNENSHSHASQVRAREFYDQFEISNNAGEMLDGGMEDYQVEKEGDQEPNPPEFDMAAQRLEQICRYSHRILKKYVVNGMITLQDGPKLHNLVDARDYRIICILEVYSQTKNEDDFLENLGLLTQVIKEQQDQERDEAVANTSINSEEDRMFKYEQEATIMDDSFLVMINEATRQSLIDVNIANWCIDQKNQENRRLTSCYNAYKKNENLNDLVDSFKRLYNNAKK